MKMILSIIVAFAAIGANATPKETRSPVRIVKPNTLLKRDVTHTYSGPHLIGRVSLVTYQVELVGFTVVDPSSDPERKVKAVLDFTPADPDDADLVAAAIQSIATLVDTKRGVGSDSSSPIGKVVTVAYDPADVSVDTTNCLGADLEVPNQADSAVKECYRVAPADIIQHAP